MENMKFFQHKDRHVVVSTSEEKDGLVSVKWVDFKDGVGGLARRGRRPGYAKPVSMSELTPVQETDELKTKATRVLSQAAGTDSSSSN